ncbi:MAG: TlpA disulfide reductase family protein [Methylococcaceae bacterium]
MTKKEIALIIMVAVIALAAGQLTRYSFKPVSNNPNIVLPHFDFPDTQGELRHNHEWQGKIIVFNFWATWCASCREEIPLLVQLQSQYQDKNVQFVGISIDEDKAVINDYLKTLNINYPILIAGDGGMRLARRLGDSSQAIPFTIIVNSQGEIIYNHEGELTKVLFEQIIMPLL